jgi:predicted O-linked N-acetylglucosamine transferase (SPINDLY family)
LQKKKNNKEALTLHDHAIKLNPNLAEVWTNRGIVLNDLKRHEEALASHDRCLELKPDSAKAWRNRGVALSNLKRHEAALASYERSIELKPDSAEAWSNRGAALNDLKRHEEALASSDRSIELKPDYAEAWSNRGIALNDLKRHEEAAESHLKADSLKKQKSFDLGRAHHQMMLSCNWTNYGIYTQRINEGIERGDVVSEPFGYQGIAESELLLKKCAEAYCNHEFPANLSLFSLNRSRKSRIKIGYLCGEFRNQATSHLMTGIWEHHDSSKFELFGLDSGGEDDSDYRKRIKIAFPNFSDISRLSDFETARFISENGIDILVNLNGYFGKARQGVFALKPAPISINYLGFPGTIGASYIDYLIADEIVIPRESIEFYTEKIIYLPFSYQANDDQRAISSRAFTRADFGLPENNFIFCCFNNNYKITPSMFATWMEILKATSQSSLWILRDNGEAEKNLIAEAINYGINPNRLIFASRMKSSEHIGRHKLADLFLDTLPYNAHTTASDALWAGLPLLTLKGKTFPGRVGASLLNAIGLPEMVTYSYEEYANAAIALAKNPTKLTAIKTKLAQNRLTTPLFNTKLCARHIEAAYQAAYDRYQAGLPPDHMDVGP